MEVTFVNPGVDYMIERIMAFQTEDESAFWSETLYHFYPQLDKVYATRLPFPERKEYIERTMRAVYIDLEDTINEKVALFSRHWETCKDQITAALSDAFGVDCTGLFNDIRCNVSLNPIEPRFLKERCYDTFYLNSERGAIGGGIHEIVHYVWFYVWNQLFEDSYDEYERPSMKWILTISLFQQGRVALFAPNNRPPWLEFAQKRYPTSEMKWGLTQTEEAAKCGPAIFDAAVVRIRFWVLV